MAVTSRDAEKYANTNTQQGGLTEVTNNVLLYAKRQIKVASVAKVVEITDEYVNVNLIPQVSGETTKKVLCQAILQKDSSGNYYSLKDDIVIGDYVLVLFLDRNTSQNLSQIENGYELSTLTENKDLHSDKFGIIIAIIYKSSSEEE